MTILNWLERQGYLSHYPGEWIVLSGQTNGRRVKRNAHKLESHGKERERAMKVIRLMAESAPTIWTMAIKVPFKLPTHRHSEK